MIRWLAAFSLILGTVLSVDFSPGCSFVGNQCMYTVKLGHSGQCDTPTTTAPTSGGGACCDDLNTKYSQLKDDLEQLTLKVNAISSALSSSDNKAAKMKEELQKAHKARDDIVAVLGRKESELNSTKAALAKVMAKAASEIQRLRKDLSNAKSSSCQTGVTANPQEVTTDITAVHPGDYSVTYYNFNSPPQAFTFTKSQYGNFKISRMSGGSSVYSGPRVEHTWGINKGTYLGINTRSIASSTPRGRINSLTAESGTFPQDRAYCIMFWYFMEGINVQTLTVNLRIRGGTGYPVFSKKGPNKSQKWELAIIDLDSEYTANQFKIDFTMTTNAFYTYTRSRKMINNANGDIAIDDLYVYNATCASIPRYPQSSYRNFVNNVTSFYTFHATPMTWTEAYDVCRRAGPWSALVSIESDEEQAFLVNTIKGSLVLLSIGQNGFYTSGSDADKEYVFSWTNTGVRRKVSTDQWHPGQPNNVAGNQDCLLMEYPNSNYEWGDVACDTKHPFICEVEVEGRV